MDPAARLYSCDDHLDMPAVPPGLWQSRLPRAEAERGPHVVTRDGKSVWVCEDGVLGISGRFLKSDAFKSLSAIGRAGIEDDGYRAGNARLRLQDMDRDSVWASVIYGPLALGLPIRDPALQNACYAAWNDWAVQEFNAVAPDRLCALAFLPGHSPEAAAASTHSCNVGRVRCRMEIDAGRSSSNLNSRRLQRPGFLGAGYEVVGRGEVDRVALPRQRRTGQRAGSRSAAAGVLSGHGERARHSASAGPIS